MVRVTLFLMSFVLFYKESRSLCQTDTHTYMICAQEQRLLVIDRSTGEEKWIKIGKCPRPLHFSRDFLNGGLSLACSGFFQDALVLHQGKGYFVTINPHVVNVFDLQTHTFEQPIPLSQYPQPMTVYGNYGYVVNFGSDSVSVVDLSLRAVVRTIPVRGKSLPLVVHGEKGYVVNQETDTLSVIDLKTNIVIQEVPTGSCPRQFLVHNNLGYLLCYDEDHISVLDLSTYIVQQTIDIGSFPIFMSIYDQKVYIGFEGSSMMTVLNLDDYSLGRAPDAGDLDLVEITHREDMVYVTSINESVRLIDLKKGKTAMINVDEGQGPIYLSDTHFYRDMSRSTPLYPTKALFAMMLSRKQLNDYVAMNRAAFDFGCVEKRIEPRKRSDFEVMGQHLLLKELLDEWVDPLDALALLTTLFRPVWYLKSFEGRQYREKLYLMFFQAVWNRENRVANQMAVYFVQLNDPVIRPLVDQFKPWFSLESLQAFASLVSEAISTG